MNKQEKKDIATKLLWDEISKGNLTIGLSVEEMVEYVDLDNADSFLGIINAVKDYLSYISNNRTQ